MILVSQRNEANDATDPADDVAPTNDTSLLSLDKKVRKICTNIEK